MFFDLFPAFFDSYCVKKNRTVLKIPYKFPYKVKIIRRKAITCQYFVLNLILFHPFTQGHILLITSKVTVFYLFIIKQNDSRAPLLEMKKKSSNKHFNEKKKKEKIKYMSRFFTHLPQAASLTHDQSLSSSLLSGTSSWHRLLLTLISPLLCVWNLRFVYNFFMSFFSLSGSFSVYVGWCLDREIQLWRDDDEFEMYNNTK